MQATVKLTVRIPAKLHEQLRQRARQNDQSLNKIVVATLQEGLTHPLEYRLSNHAKFQKVLRDSGMLVELGPEWLTDLDNEPMLTHEELWELTKGLPPLSETIIEDRGPR